MKTKFAIMLICYATILQSVAQPIKNFDAKGKVQTSTADFLSVTDGNTKAFTTALIPVIVGAGINIYNTIKERKKATYTGVYSNTFSFAKLPETITLNRLMLADKKEVEYGYKEVDPIASKFILDVSNKPGGITIKLVSGSLNRSKAYFKRGHTLAITIDIKIMGTAEDGSALDIGEASIIIPMIYVRNEGYNFKAPGIERYITEANFLPLPEKTSDRSVSIAFKITEVNLNKVVPSVVESILKSNGSDLTDLLKGALGFE